MNVVGPLPENLMTMPQWVKIFFEGKKSSFFDIFTYVSFQISSCNLFPNINRHSSIYAVNVWTQNKNRGSKNRINWGYLVVIEGKKLG